MPDSADVAAAPRDPLLRWAVRAPERAALVAAGRTWSYAELAGAAVGLARGLRGLGLPRGARVVWTGSNAPELWITAQACRLAGLVSVPMSFRATAQEMAHMFRTAEAALVVADAVRAPVAVAAAGDVVPPPVVVAYGADVEGARRWGEVADGDPDISTYLPVPAPELTVFFTSGTSGLPKGALRRSIDPASLEAQRAEFGFREGERHLVAGPLYHSGPLRWAQLVVGIGGTLVLMPRFDPVQFLRLARHADSTFLAPTMLKQVLALPEAQGMRPGDTALRCLVVSGSPAPMSVKTAAVRAFGDVVFECYGSTETGANVVLRPEDQLRKPGSCGRPIRGMSVRVLDDDGLEVPVGTAGEVFIASPTAAERYLGDGGALRAVDGHVSAGDIGYVDDEGYLYLVDRRNDTISSGGVNVYPAEIEAALHAHPGVVDVAVFGVPSQEWGEAVHAAVVCAPGAHVDGPALAAYARERIAAYKVPRSWEFVDALPRNEAGKLERRRLKGAHWTTGSAQDVARS